MKVERLKSRNGAVDHSVFETIKNMYLLKLTDKTFMKAYETIKQK